MKQKSIFIIITIILIILVVVFTIISNNKNDLINNKSIINRNSKIEDIVFENDKVNIYLFWGDGCPHCEKLLNFLESINNEYNKYYNVYAFEVWFNQSNAKLMKKLSEIMDEQIKGVPYTIIGDKTFSGFENSMKIEIQNAIKDQSQKNFDVYKNLKKN